MQVETHDRLPERIGPYRLDGLLGVGGMGEVYRAHDERLDRWVALKQISARGRDYQRLRQRFRREARAAARLNHPAIVQIYDVIEGRGADWIVMELVEGETLAQQIREGPFELRRLLETANALVSGLAAAHDEGIIHRDLKAENIMLTRGGKVKILDFGLAKQVWQTDSEISLSVEGTLLGTARAMAPEQALGKKVDHRSDLFAFGILLYEMATGKSPFLGPTAVETAIRVCSHRQTPARQHNPSIPEALSRLIDRLLEKDPERRIGSILLVSAELEDLLGQASEAALAQDSAEVSAPLWRGSVIEPSLDGEPSQTLAGALSQVTPRSEEGQGLESSFGAPSRPTRRPSKGAKVVSKVWRERRQVTVLCCDLVNAAGESGSDPEALYDVTQEFQDRARTVVQRFGGHLERAPDHRVLAYFGYPKARQDAALRAVITAHTMVSEVAEELESRLEQDAPPRWAVRVGIHSGPGVVQVVEETSRLSLGQTLDRASALKNRAAPNTVLVSGDTARLVEQRCELEAMPRVRSRDPQRSISAFLCRPRTLAGLTADPSSAPSDLVRPPLCGRSEELALLESRWRLARQGSGQVLTVVAESGIGKTRLVEAFLETTWDESALVLVARGSFQHQDHGFGTVVSLLHQLFEIGPQDGAEEQLDKIEGLLRHLDAPLEEMVPLLAELLSLSTQRRYPGANPAIEPPGKTLDTLLALILEGARWRPMMIVVEDLQWVDASTVELLSRIMKRGSAVPLLALLTHRPEFAPPWGDSPSVTRLSLDTLRWPEASDLLGGLSPEGLDPAVRQRLLERSDGVPRFLVELARDVGDSRGLDQRAIPVRLLDLLMARLDRLGPAKELAQLASVVGRCQPESLLQAIYPRDQAVFEEHLERLATSGVMLRRGFLGDSECAFRLTLVREMAYGTLLLKERQRLHRQVATSLDELRLAGETVAESVLAHHRSQAGDWDLAVTHYEEAARQEMDRGDPQRAIEFLESGLQRLHQLPEDAPRERRELALLTALGPLISGARGYEDPKLETLYSRAGELCLQQGNEAENFRVLRSISAFFIARARPKRSLPLVKKLLQIAEEAEDRELIIESCYAIGLTQFTLGELGLAQLHLERGIHLDQGRIPELVEGESSEDPGIACQALGALVTWHQGEVDEAVELSNSAVAKARQLDHAGTLAAALSFAAWLHQLRRDHSAVEELAQETVLLSQQGGFLLWSTYGQLLLGWARLGQGKNLHPPEASGSENTTQVGRRLAPPGEGYLGLSLDVYRDAGVLFAQTYLLSLLAESSTERGEVDRALRHLLEALTAVEQSGERFWQAELLRLCGVMVLQNSGDALDDDRRREAEGYFERALHVARHQGCRSLELRAVASLGRMWAERGMVEQAKKMVETVYLGFDQGMDSADLVETRQWLDSLG